MITSFNNPACLEDTNGVRILNGAESVRYGNGASSVISGYLHYRRLHDLLALSIQR